MTSSLSPEDTERETTHTVGEETNVYNYLNRNDVKDEDTIYVQSNNQEGQKWYKVIKKLKLIKDYYGDYDDIKHNKKSHKKRKHSRGGSKNKKSLKKRKN